MCLFLPHLIYVNAIPCQTQLLQTVTLCGDYLYQLTHLCFINSTEGPRDSIILCIKYFTVKIADNKITD